MVNDDETPNVLREEKQEVVITPEDVAGAAEFWTQFEVPMPPELKAAFEAFVANPTVENQTEVKLQVTRAIGHTDHEAFNDEMFTEIREECRASTYDLGFNKALESHLQSEDK